MSRPGRRSATSSSLWCRRTNTGPAPDWRRSPESVRRPRALMKDCGRSPEAKPLSSRQQGCPNRRPRRPFASCFRLAHRRKHEVFPGRRRRRRGRTAPGPVLGRTVLLGAQSFWEHRTAQDSTAGSGLIDCGGGCCELVVLTRRLTRAGRARRNPLCGHQIGSLGRSLVEIRRKRRWAAWTHRSSPVGWCTRLIPRQVLRR